MAFPVSDFTKTVHSEAYPAISPKRPELSQAGRTVLITGGGTGVGKEMAANFAIAKAAKVIIVGRRVGVLETAVAELEKIAKDNKSPTKFVAKKLDGSSTTEINALFDELGAQKTTIDVLVLNAVRFSDPKSLLDLGIEELWKQFETNVKGPLLMVERFQKQPSESKRVILHLATTAMHMVKNPLVALRPAYALTKISATTAIQLIADSVDVNKIQIISFHPGIIYSDIFQKAGISKTDIPFDELDLPGGLSVWAASDEAKFLHGRYVMSGWDVTELAQGDIRKELEENDDFLRISVIGVKVMSRA